MYTILFYLYPSITNTQNKSSLLTVLIQLTTFGLSFYWPWDWGLPRDGDGTFELGLSWGFHVQEVELWVIVLFTLRWGTSTWRLGTSWSKARETKYKICDHKICDLLLYFDVLGIELLTSLSATKVEIRLNQSFLRDSIEKGKKTLLFVASLFGHIFDGLSLLKVCRVRTTRFFGWTSILWNTCFSLQRFLWTHFSLQRFLWTQTVPSNHL